MLCILLLRKEGWSKNVHYFHFALLLLIYLKAFKRLSKYYDFLLFLFLLCLVLIYIFLSCYMYIPAVIMDDIGKRRIIFHRKRLVLALACVGEPRWPSEISDGLAQQFYLENLFGWINPAVDWRG